MRDNAPDVAAAFSTLLERIPKECMDLQQGSRRLLLSDPLERLVPAKLLKESLASLLDELAPAKNPIVLFMDRAGGGDGAQAAADIMPVLGKRWPGSSFVHVAFATQPQGVGVLIRGVLMRAGAMNRIAVQVVAHNRPAEGLDLTAYETTALFENCNLIITYAPGGTAGLSVSSHGNPLLRCSHLNVLSYPDPDDLVAGLGELRAVVKRDESPSAVRLRIQILRRVEFEDLGTTTLLKDNDITVELGTLLNAAEPHTYQVLLEPLKSDATLNGVPLVCPKGAAIAEHLRDTATILRTVPSGSRLVTVARGKETLL